MSQAEQAPGGLKPTGRQAAPGKSGRGDVVAALIAGALLTGLVAGRGLMARVFPGEGAGPAPEAIQRTMVAQDLLQGLSRGRQGLVGSLSMAPCQRLW